MLASDKQGREPQSELGPSPEELMEEQQEAVRDVMINRSPPSEQDQVVARDVAGSEPVWEQDGAVTLTFQPGNVGLNYDRQTGIVGQVREGGQSGQSGVQPGWYIDLVEGSPYGPNMLQWLIDGCTPYKITFRKDTVTISMVFADLDYERLSANDAVKYRLEKALLEAASQVFAAYGQVALRFTGDPVLRARMYLLPRGLDFEELLAKLRAPEMSGEIAKTAANVEGVVALCDQDTELPDSLRVEQLVVTYGDVRSPEAFTLPDAEVPLTQQARQARRTSSDSTLSEAFLEGPPLPPPSEPPALGKEGEELPLDGEPAREDSALRNEEGAVVQLGDPAEGCGHLYYCGRQLGRGIIPDSDGRCGPYDGPQCPSCARLQKAMEDMFLHGVGAPDCTREVEQH